MSFIETGLDCSILPKSMSSKNGNFPDGCTGAVWSDGTPSKKYCSNDNRFPWWKNCCYWNGSKCLPKEIPDDYNSAGNALRLRDIGTAPLALDWLLYML